MNQTEIHIHGDQLPEAFSTCIEYRTILACRVQVGVIIKTMKFDLLGVLASKFEHVPAQLNVETLGSYSDLVNLDQ